MPFSLFFLFLSDLSLFLCLDRVVTILKREHPKTWAKILRTLIHEHQVTEAEAEIVGQEPCSDQFII